MPPRASRWAPLLRPAWIALVGISGFLAGLALLLIGAFQTERSAAFVQSGGFMVWAGILGAQAALWAVITLPLWADLISQWRRSRSTRLSIVVLALLLLVALSAFPFIPQYAAIDWPLWGHGPKLRILTTAAGIFVAIPALCGISSVQHEVTHGPGHVERRTAIPLLVEQHARLRRFLSAAGTVIGLAVLAVGALREATVPTFLSDTEFPQEGVLAYGALFTGLLVLVYAPAHAALRRSALDVREDWFPLASMPDPDGDRFLAWVERRSALESVLDLHASPMQRLQTSIFILAPLLSSVVTYALPTAS